LVIFELWSPTIGIDFLSEDAINDSFTRLGNKLPHGYIEILKMKNGGYLCDNEFVINSIDAPYKTKVTMLFGIGGEDGIDAFVDGLTNNQLLINEWGYPEKSIIICHQGHEGFALVYGNEKPNVVYCDFEKYPENKILKIANSFEDFFSRIVFNQDQDL
jgi:hypothetical protein